MNWQITFFFLLPFEEGEISCHEISPNNLSCTPHQYANSLNDPECMIEELVDILCDNDINTK